MAKINPTEIETLKQFVAQMEAEKEFSTYMDRGLILMEAGLEKRPLDRDLFALIKYKHADMKKENKRVLYIAKSLLAAAERGS